MYRLTRSPLRGWRWLSASLAVLVLGAGIAGWVNAAPPKDLLVPLTFLGPLFGGLMFLAFAADDGTLGQVVLWCRRYGPWLLIAMGIAIVARSLFA